MFRIKDGRNAAIKMLHTGDSKASDRINGRNAAIMGELFRRTQNGQIKGFFLVSNTEFKAYHRSTKQDGFIQLSAGFYKYGELIPCYDVQMQTADDMEREGYPSGVYAIIS